jgi:hypothetical protein
LGYLQVSGRLVPCGDVWAGVYFDQNLARVYPFIVGHVPCDNLPGDLRRNCDGITIRVRVVSGRFVAGKPPIKSSGACSDQNDQEQDGFCKPVVAAGSGQ